MPPAPTAPAFDALLARVRACRICVEAPRGRPLPHAPRPVLRISPTARLGIFGQAPGTRVHASGIPFTDPSGDRLRDWLGLAPEQFYDTSRVAILPMGFCFPGLDAKGGDRLPRRECAPRWRDEIIAAMPHLELVLLIGKYAQDWHLAPFGSAPSSARVGDTVAAWRAIRAGSDKPRLFPLPHPSWRNTGWLKANPWFAAELLPVLRADVRAIFANPSRTRASRIARGGGPA